MRSLIWKGGLACLLLFTLSFICLALNNSYFVDDLTLDPLNKASLQRGAQLYFNYCSGCHSIQYVHYNHLADMLGIENQRHQLYDDLIKKSFLFDSQANIHQPIKSSLSSDDAKKWFSVPAPDLTNITLTKSPAWVYNYLRAFYKDETRPTGSNNLIAANTAMPNVLETLRGETKPVFRSNQFDHFETTKSGQMRPLDFDHAIYDIVNFLDLVAEPEHIVRFWIGLACIALLCILGMLLYFWYLTLAKQNVRNNHHE